jgi:glycosyltransferase involved in cell wall biosynthesis
MVKYNELLGGTLVDIQDYTVDFTGADVFAFALPIPLWLERLQNIKRVAKNVVCMTVCETETVHPDYGKLFKMFNTVLVPSEFCKIVFSRQFRGTEFKVVRHWEPLPEPSPERSSAKKYVFYHIGNILDHRKQINHIIRAFQELDLPDSQLVLKATCKQPVKVNVPNVLVINGLLPKEQLDRIHNACDCYVSFSNSEGVGMGAVEAALRDKPVILSSYGGAVEYINTEYVIKCKLKTVGVDDFLYSAYMFWGDPDYETLKKHMKHAYDNKVRHVDHEYTRILLEKETIRTQLIESLSEPTDPQRELLAPERSAENEGELSCHQLDQSQWVVL